MVCAGRPRPTPAARIGILASQYLSGVSPADLQNLPPASQLQAYLQSKFVQTAVGSIAQKLWSWYSYYSFACQTSPVQLQSFSLANPIGLRPDRKSSEVDLQAHLGVGAAAN